MIKQISVVELKGKLDRKEDLFLLDVREPEEAKICSIGGELIPLGTLTENTAKVPKDKPVVVYCRSGGRSQRAIEELQQNFGYSNLINLRGGILAWADLIDPSLQKY